jgi:tRNA modification GTPase
MARDSDTIVAAATPPGRGGIGVVRISGDQTVRIARAVLGSLPEPRTATYRTFRDAEDRPLDTGIAIYYPAPASFTGEAVLELQGHGGPVLLSIIVDAILALGARQAEPGEFSQRAFLNDKLDLVQAEAIVDVIDSGTAQAARAALRSLSGAFSRAVDALAARLVALRVHVEAAIDFPEEEIDFLSDAKLRGELDACKAAFDALLFETQQGRALRDGYQVVIVGKPNAGKSSLMNLLSGQEAAIVTEVAGTTRDILREQIDIDGLAVELVDTAGLRDDPGRVEAEGIRRARKAIESADAVLWIQDATDSDQGNDNEHGRIDEALPENIPVIVVRNKIDLSGEAPGDVDNVVRLSAISGAGGAGVAALRRRIRELAGYENQGEGAFTARRRHLDALRRSQARYLRGLKALDEAHAGELLAEELRLSHQALGEITGAMSSDELLGAIFSEFCIGK